MSISACDSMRTVQTGDENAESYNVSLKDFELSMRWNGKDIQESN